MLNLVDYVVYVSIYCIKKKKKKKHHKTTSLIFNKLIQILLLF